MANNTQKLLKSAQQAYKKGKKSQGALMVERILMKDYNHRGAWELLYAQYGNSKHYEQFRLDFTNTYYPDKLPLLEWSDVIAEEKTSWLQRFFFWRKAPPLPVKDCDESALPGSITQYQGQNRKKNVPEVRLGTVNPPTRPKTSRDIVEKPAPKTDPITTSYAQTSSVQPSAFSGNGYQPIDGSSKADVQDRVIRVMVVDDIAQTRENIIRSLRFHQEIEIVGTATNGAEAINLAKETRPDVVLMDVNMPDMDGITATRGVLRAVPFTQVVILTIQDDTDYMRKAMLAGARDFLTKPPMIDELIGAVRRAAEIAFQEKRKSPGNPTNIQSSSPLPASQGSIITVYSPKGGTGRSMLASNLAVALHNEDTPVIIVDGNLQYGDIPIFFNEQSRNSIIDLAPRADDLDPEILDEVAIRHKTGIKILAPPRPEHAEEVKGKQFESLLAYLRKQFAYVIVDTSTLLSDITIAAIDISDLVVLITTQDIPTIASVRKFIDLLPLLKFDPKRILVVMNQFDHRLNIKPERVGQTFQQKIVNVIPADSRVVVPSINRGVPFMLQNDVKTKDIAQAFYTLAGTVRERLVELNQISEEAVLHRVN